MIKQCNITLKISDYDHKGIIILVPKKEIRVKFKKGATIFDMNNDGISVSYSKNKTVIGLSKQKHLGKPILSMDNINDSSIYFIPTNLKKYKVIITDINKAFDVYKYLSKKLTRYYQ
jgi:hypothetical protein